MLTIVTILAPVFLIVLLGWVLALTGFLSHAALAEINRLSYWFGLPALLFHRLATASPEFSAVGGLLAALTGATLLGIMAGGVCAATLGLPRVAVGTFIQGVFRGNLAFIGLPVVLYAFAGSPGSEAGAESRALLAFGPTVVLYNVLAVAVLLAPSAQGGLGPAVARAAYGMVSNPILIACVAGVAYSLSGLGMPGVVGRTLSAIGQMALPLALVCIGGALYWTRVRGHLRRAGLAALLKVSVLPALGLALAWWLGLSPEHTRIVGILLACPTASASYLLASQLGGDGGLASSIVVLSTLLAVPAMILVLWVTAPPGG